MSVRLHYDVTSGGLRIGCTWASPDVVRGWLAAYGYANDVDVSALVTSDERLAAVLRLSDGHVVPYDGSPLGARVAGVLLSVSARTSDTIDRQAVAVTPQETVPSIACPLDHDGMPLVPGDLVHEVATGARVARADYTVGGIGVTTRGTPCIYLWADDVATPLCVTEFGTLTHAGRVRSMSQLLDLLHDTLPDGSPVTVDDLRAALSYDHTRAAR